MTADDAAWILTLLVAVGILAIVAAARWFWR